MTETELKKGTTTLGLVCTNGVVMATERRATMGHLIAHKNTQKLFRINNHMGLTVAGLVGDAQLLARWLTAEAHLFEFKRGRPMSLRAAATLMSNIMNGRRMMPFWVQLLLGGIDDEGGHIYSLDAAGGSIPDQFTTTGSGSPMVYGVLEDHYRSDITTTKGTKLAVRALTAAMRRDSASGDGINICVIDGKGYHTVDEVQVSEIQAQLQN